MNTLTADRVSQWKGRLIDVRNLNEFAAERLPQAECVPLDRLMSAAGGWDRNEPILLMCKSGVRSGTAAGQLIGAGFTNVHTLTGGIDACKRAGVEVIITRRTIPVIRQVMIAAGALLLLGLILARVNPWFILLDWFVAAGLLFAGLTGCCPMARLLEIMPWNTAPACAGGDCAKG